MCIVDIDARARARALQAREVQHGTANGSASPVRDDRQSAEGRLSMDARVEASATETISTLRKENSLLGLRLKSVESESSR